MCVRILPSTGPWALCVTIIQPASWIILLQGATEHNDNNNSRITNSSTSTTNHGTHLAKAMAMMT